MDLFLFRQLNDFAGKWPCLDDLGIFLAKYFEYFLIAFLLLFLLLRFRKYWKMVVLSFVSAVLARLVIVNIIRWIWIRPRPFVENTVNLLLNYADKPSFPSGHAAFYFAIATVVFYKDQFIGTLFFVATILICLARIFVGVHWPSDILVGALIGILCGWVIKEIFKKL